MVTVTKYLQKKNSEGKKFFSFELTGEVEVSSSQSGKMYASAKKCILPTTLDEQACKDMVGKQLPGSIKKVDSEPYEYKVPKTGEIITLAHKYEYSYEESNSSLEVTPFQPELQLN